MGPNPESAIPLEAPVLQALLDIIPGTLHVKDRWLRYCVVNRYYLERWGLPASEVIGRRSSEIFGDEFDVVVEARDREVLETGEPLPFYEVEYPTEDGGTVALWATKVPILDDAGRPSHVLTLALDITPLKHAQRALDESEQVRSAMVEHALDSIIAFDQNGAIVEFNPAAERTFGYRRADVLGTPAARILAPDRDPAAVVVPFASAASGRRIQSEAERADGV